MICFEFNIHGPIRGGKNGVLINRSGHRYPNPVWAKWRDHVVSGIRELYPNPETITTPCSMTVRYWNTELKRRDVPAMADSIFHICEKAGLIADDELIRSFFWYWEGHDQAQGRAKIVIEKMGTNS